MTCETSRYLRFKNQGFKKLFICPPQRSHKAKGMDCVCILLYVVYEFMTIFYNAPDGKVGIMASHIINIYIFLYT